MRTADVILRSGDRLPSVRRQVLVDGVAVNLTDYTATFNYQTVAGGALTTVAATIADAANGYVQYDWQATDAAKPAGFYAAWFEVITTGKTLSVPNDGFLLLQIVADGAAEFSYSGDPSARALDAVRYLIQDTDASSPQQRDSEILWQISQWGEGNTRMAAAACADVIAAKYSAEAAGSRTVGDLTISTQATGKAKEYASLAARLRREAMFFGGPRPTCGSTSAPRQFAIGEGDNPSSSLPNYLGGGATST